MAVTSGYTGRRCVDTYRTDSESCLAVAADLLIGADSDRAETGEEIKLITTSGAADSAAIGGTDPEGRSRMRRTLRLDDRREPKVAEIAEWIAIGIVEGALAPDQDLNSVELAKRFGTSRTPVREALMLLEQEGLVAMQARRRPRVATISASDIRDIYQVRADLLSRMVRLVVERASDEQLRDVSSDLDQLRAHQRANDVDGYFWAHVALQERLAEIANNWVLKQILDSLALRTLVLRHRSLSRPGRLKASLADQVRLFEALTDRDADLAAAVIAGATRAAQRAIEDGFSAEVASA